MPPILIRCHSLPPALSELQSSGYVLLAICPADAPCAALLGRGSEGRTPPSPTIQLVVDSDPGWENALRILEGAESDVGTAREGEWVVSRGKSDEETGEGRAGMRYRDLIPGRLEGLVVASLISIPDGGPVADYVHHHRIRFQMIFCRKGWVKVVYENNGPPFIMHPGDCVIQPPHIRHRVLESSPGLEVVELASPAIHATFPDPSTILPNTAVDPDKVYSGQKFVRHVAENATWRSSNLQGWEERDLGIAAATGGAYASRVHRALALGRTNIRHDHEMVFWFVLSGKVEVSRGAGEGKLSLGEGDSVVLPARQDALVEGDVGTQLLEVEFRRVKQ
ncbi:hypothetical protein HDU93_008293 [Gonapodya sp. JEL0774]|nr:hypothetical protein HDU93_008293 [Gonapodya sp. JEL0774]